MSVAAAVRSRVAASQPGESALPFWALMFFTFVLFVGPQFIFPELHSFHLAKVSAGLAFVAYLFDRRGERLTVNARPVRLVFYLVLLAAYSIPYSSWPGGSFESLTNEFLKSVVIFLLVANTVNTVRRMKLMIGSLAVWGVVMAATANWDYATGQLAVQGIRIAGYEAPLTGDPNDLALTLNLILGLLVGLFMATQARVRKLVLLGVMALLAAGVIASFSRGGFLALTVVAVLFVGKEAKQRGPAVLGLALALLVLALIALPAGYGDRIRSIFDTSADATGSAETRWQGMIVGLTLMLDHPLLGLGLNMHNIALAERGLGWNPTHSAFIQVGADLGVAGFLLYVLLFWQLFRDVRRSRTGLAPSREGRELLGLAAGVETALVAFVVGGALLPVAYRFYGFYIAGFAVAVGEIARPLRGQR